MHDISNQYQNPKLACKIGATLSPERVSIRLYFTLREVVGYYRYAKYTVPFLHL